MRGGEGEGDRSDTRRLGDRQAKVQYRPGVTALGGLGSVNAGKATKAKQ